MAKLNSQEGGRAGSGKSWVLWVLGLVLMTLWLVRGSQTGVPTVDYSEFKRRLAASELREVDIAKDRLYATDRNGGHLQTIRVEDPNLIRELDAKGVPYRGRVESDWGNLVGMLAFLLGPIALAWLLFARRMRPGAGVMAIGKNRARLVAEEGTGVTFADVAGADEAVEELREIVEFLATPERFRRLGGRIPKGVLLVGPPGTGKTLLARAVAGEAKVPFFSLTGSDFVEMFVGVGAARVRDLFQQAQSKAPCIIFIDELDAIGKSRSAATLAGHDEREQTLNQLLAEMDGFDPRRGLIIMAATNRPEILDSALLRPGRFDRHVVVDRPDLRGRESILHIHARDVKLSPEVDLHKVAALTPGFAGAELANVVNESALLAARRRRDEVTPEEFTEAIERVMAGLEKKNRRMNEREKTIVAHHESGHALLAEILPTTDRVHKVSMIPRGLGALGYTMQLPLEDRYLMGRHELYDKITVLMGGRAAEQVVFHEISTGASDDLIRATDLARRMVVQYGMSEQVGPQALREDVAGEFLGGLRLPQTRPFGERTADAVDEEVSAILRSAYRRALRLCEYNLAKVRLMAQKLLEKEVLEGPELRAILVGAEAPSEPESDALPGWGPAPPYATSH
jgi:cell division protease FtsH